MPLRAWKPEAKVLESLETEMIDSGSEEEAAKALMTNPCYC
jgi:hypothetical protein